MKRTHIKMAATLMTVCALGAAILWNKPTEVVAAEAATYPIAVDKTNFPDSHFRKAVQTFADTDGDNLLTEEEVTAVKTVLLKYVPDAQKIKVYEKNSEVMMGFREYSGIKVDFTGLEYFTQIETLSLTNMDYENLPFDKLINLKTLYLGSLPKGPFEFSQSANVQELICTGMHITSMDLSKLSQLKKLKMANCTFDEFDISALTNLEEIYIPKFNLDTMDVRKNTNLRRLNVSEGQLTSLDIRGLAKLKMINIDKNPFKEINKDTLKADGNAKLKTIFFEYGKECRVFDVSHIPSVEEISIFFNHFQKIKLGKNVSTLCMGGSNMKVINSATLVVPENSKLKYIDASYNQKITKANTNHIKNLEELDLNHCSKLIYVNTAENDKLSYLNLGGRYKPSLPQKVILNKNYPQDWLKYIKKDLKATGGKVIFAPDQVTGLRAVKKTKTSIKLTFNAVSDAKGYKIYDADTGKAIASVSPQKGKAKIVKTVKGLKPGKTYRFKVRAFVTDGGTKYYGTYSKVYTKATAK